MKVLLGEWNSEVAVDLIDLINGAKKFEKKGEAAFNGRRYSWVLLDDILDYVKKSSNWAVLQPMGTNEMGVQAVKTILIHKTGTILESEWVELGYKENDTPQDKGAKDTYVRRYSLGSLLGIAVGSDNDGELDQKTDEEIAEESLKRQNRKTQRDITTFFEEILTEIGSRELLYERLGVERDAFLTSYNENPKDLLAQMKRVFVKDKE